MESMLARLVRERERVRARVDADDRPDLVQSLGCGDPLHRHVQDRKRFACLRGRATLRDVEHTLSQRVGREESRAGTG
jgi:hypothetical protein